MWEGEQEPTERYVFLFKNKLMFTDKNSNKDTPSYKHYATIRVRRYIPINSGNCLIKLDITKNL